MTKKDSVYIEYYNITSMHGTVQSYFHFLYSALFPIILDANYYSSLYNKVTFIIDTNFGPMLRILLQMPLDIKIKKYMENYDEIPEKNIIKKYLKVMDLHPDPLKKKSNWIEKGWATSFTNKMYNLINKWMYKQINDYDIIVNPITKYDIIIIERRKDISYRSICYSRKNKSKEELNKLDNIIRKTGSDRRDIVNFKEFSLFVVKYFKNYSCLVISFEYIPIFTQYQLLNNSKILIAQHGAVLGNIPFMKSESLVIEIMPQEKIDEKEDWFKPIANTCNVDLVKYIVPDNFANIDLKQFKVLLDKNDVINYLK
jgi:hypothetical protein